MEDRIADKLLEVPKRTVSARVWLAGIPPREVELFLKDHSQWRAGPELPPDIFLDNRPYVPVQDPEWGVVLLRRDSMMALTVDLEHIPSRRAPDPGYEPNEVEVSVFLRDGAVLRGQLEVLLHGQALRRLQDFLNSEDRAFTIRDQGRAHVISKDWTTAVRASD